ncbi:bifunctional 2-C-methyl-D-erythritol 4-phosphate cytidylyltransferase/2-C-methyl-D-erythritol 2,4-cyclodiphosphate synthase [Pseudaminobacter sp. 19-2017]|uniref:Bifunctional enzyme IspD/IspF n=1 Tax=Pseudaminobacter soli (ex Zhang et al. 2022) TaxID=2831468 RepID=A0A942DY61_9HYPH|nr:bifunctional 2-C-methyl-D-erythritol 4-phosphate cytidylyltransferase/2-C-methyl-D-erythritol 2,4-cyclodiphosphate synthase [Pseudaminobacter soli]MBS3647100.1 bifunctional 2-C-methyl-D-erythritol 4-phosphate cytidylyltransferase/2-C-methyl-D-erythritol 2,4-cyclodiphosphate synthase [Pseudaminobacter soli]
MPTDSRHTANDSVAAIIVAAGRGERAGREGGPKQYRQIGGKAVIARCLEVFLSHPRISHIVAVIHPDDHELFRAAVGDLADRIVTVEGGATRQESVLAGLEALKNAALAAVLIHDAVRPFVTADLIDRVSATALKGTAALPAIPLADTVKRADERLFVTATVSREDLYAAQTPQGFPYRTILDAHRRAVAERLLDFTDDAAIAEWAGLPVRIVEGSPDNRKLTWTRDIEMADRQLAGNSFPDVRTGNGYDVHAFEPGEHVTLCGVAIPHDRRLMGHSDADVGLHALTDALLATCGAGDIGTHFPPSDPQWKGAASHLFVEHAASLVRSHGGRIANVDVTLICEAPKIGPHREAMTAVLAGILGIRESRISVKATTNERLGFIGRQEGIAAIATASVVFPGQLED